jgi:hypothetical protein
VNSTITKSFRKRFTALPGEVAAQARAAYRLWKESPYHPGLQFKRVSHGSRSILFESVSAGVHSDSWMRRPSTGSG